MGVDTKNNLLAILRYPHKLCNQIIQIMLISI